MRSTIIILLIVTIIGWIFSTLVSNIRRKVNKLSQHLSNKEGNAHAEAEAFEEAYQQQRQHESYNSKVQSADEIPTPTVEHARKSVTTANAVKSNLQTNNKNSAEQDDSEKATPRNPIVEELNLSDPDNARKAFIASELLKRKY